MSKPSEPAIKSYFFGKGYRDLGAVISDSWHRNLDSAQHELKQARSFWPREYHHKGLALLRGSAGVSVLVFGMVFFLAASALHIVVLGTFFLLIYLGFTLVYFTERLYLLYQGFFTVCPHCHHKYPLPEYFCPRCGEVHRRLTPSSYGILYRTCQCGQRLPATFFLNRGQLESRCPQCEDLLKTSHSESKKAFIPIVGGPSVGKSAYLFSAVTEMIEEMAPRLRLSHSFLDKTTERDFKQVRNDLATGQPPDKTLDALPRAFNLRLEKGRKSPRVLYLYDPAGETFSDTEGLVLHKFHEYPSGLIFMVDPFAIPAVRMEYEDRLTPLMKAIKPSALPIEDALSRLLLSMEENFGLSKTSQIKVPVAVVLSKVDVFDLEDRIGEAAVRAHAKTRPPSDDPHSVRDELLRRQLIRWEQGDMVQQLESRCRTVRFFTCSSLGRSPDGSGKGFQARRVLEPLLWILGHTDSLFGSTALRKK